MPQESSGALVIFHVAMRNSIPFKRFTCRSIYICKIILFKLVYNETVIFPLNFGQMLAPACMLQTED